ncbi:hypothetical protein IAT38_006001 [Cryptococcus sp. DSM 104549]
MPSPAPELAHANAPPFTTPATPSSSTPTTIRFGTPSDAAALSHLIGSTFAQAFGHSVSPADLENYLTTSVSVEQIRKDLENPQNVFIVADGTQASGEGGKGEDGEILGVAQLAMDSTEPCLTLPKPIELRRLYVTSSQHGTGLAARLVSAAEEKGRELGAESIWLGVWEDNGRGKRFYEKTGFEIKGDHWFTVGEIQQRDWVMEKAL